MKTSKIITILFILFFINITSLYAKEVKCKYAYKRFKLDYGIKSVVGWEMACNNNKIYLYLDNNITYENINIICNCIKKDYIKYTNNNKRVLYDNY